MAALNIHISYTLRNRVSRYQRKAQTGLFGSPAMTRTQKRDLQALPQHNAELEQTVQQANLLILALHPMMEVAEQELPLSSRKWLAPNGPETPGKRNRSGERRSPMATVWCHR